MSAAQQFKADLAHFAEGLGYADRHAELRGIDESDVGLEAGGFWIVDNTGSEERPTLGG